MWPEPGDGRRLWTGVVRRFLSASVIGHLVWEMAQIRLYTIGSDGTPGDIAFAILHCSGGDLLIAAASLVPALLIVGPRAWVEGRGVAFAAIVVAGGVAYTILSEWWNVEVARSWTYAGSMPRLPWIGTGLSPLLQWLVVPSAALWWARRAARPSCRAC